MTTTKTEWHTFNLNDYVRVKLTDKGREIYMQEFERFGIEVGPPREDADGWVSIQCWSLMQIFGSYLVMGCELPFSTDIQFQV